MCELSSSGRRQASFATTPAAGGFDFTCTAAADPSSDAQVVAVSLAQRAQHASIGKRARHSDKDYEWPKIDAKPNAPMHFSAEVDGRRGQVIRSYARSRE
jgi:hypothetical protein